MNIRLRTEDRCPHIITKSAGDESYDCCELTERPSGRIKPCLLESSSECEIWEEIQKEQATEVGEQAKLNQEIEMERAGAEQENHEKYLEAIINEQV